MSKYLQDKPVIGIIAVCVIICAAMTQPAGAQFGRAGDGYDAGSGQPRQPVDRQQQAKLAMETAAREMDQMLVQILEMVNRQTRPQPDMLDASKRAAAAAGKYATRYNAALKCEIFMLRAWNGYFADNMPTAMMAASQAYKTDSTNRDAEATQVIISVLMGRKPKKIVPRQPRPTPPVNNLRGGNNVRGGNSRGANNPRSRRSSREESYAGGQNTQEIAVNATVSTGNILDLDIDAIDLGLIGQTVPTMQVKCLNSTTLDYDPAQSTLCILFWQLDSKSAPGSGEPNNMTTNTPRPTPRPMPRRSTDRSDRRRRGDYEEDGDDRRRRGGNSEEDGDYNSGNSGYVDYRQPDIVAPTAPKGTSVAGEIKLYGQLFGSYLANPKVKFLAVNTDPATSTPAVVNKLLESPWPWAHVMAAQPGSGMAQYAGMDCKQPTFAIVNASGTISYAGPVAGFLPQMALTHFAGASVASESLKSPVGTTPPRPTIKFNPFKGLLGGGKQQTPAKTTTGTTATGSDTTPPPDQTNENDDEITPESYQAGKLLEYAKMYIKAGRQPVLTSKRAVDICRQLIREYPNTKYEQEARLLLRKVPEYERKRYKITDEEMGL